MMEDEKRPEPETEAEKMMLAMGDLTHAVFDLPPEMRERAVYALLELVGPSRAECRAKTEAREAGIEQVKLVFMSKIVAAWEAYMQRPDHHEIPPPPPESVPNH